MEKALRKYLPKGEFQDVSEKRSKAMAAVRGSQNKTTEQRLRMALVQSGITGWQVRPKGLKGSPDFFFPREKVAVFVDGCFWHGCPECGHIPKKNRAFWQAKIERNRERDLQTKGKLQVEDITVLRFWEHELTDELSACIEKVRLILEGE